MRVLHVSSGNLYGGVEVFLNSLVSSRNSLRHEFALCFQGKQSQQLRQLKIPSYFLHEAKFSRPWTVFRARQRLRNLLKKKDYDVIVVHSCWTWALVGPVIKKMHCRKILWIYNEVNPRHWISLLARQTQPDEIFAISHFVGKLATKLFPKSPVEVAYLPCFAKTVNKPTARSKIRRNLNAATNDVIILQVSRLEPGKGHLNLIDALAELDPSLPWQCWIEGTAQRPLENKLLTILKNRVRSLGLENRVHFIGSEHAVLELMASADIFCQPNVQAEGYGFVFIESLLQSVPVITTSVGGGAEIVTPETGILVPPNNKLALRDSLQALITNDGLRTQLGKAGPLRARSLSGPDNALPHIIELISQKKLRKTA